MKAWKIIGDNGREYIVGNEVSARNEIVSGMGKEKIELTCFTDAELKEEINKHIQTIARCGKAGVFEAYLAGQLEEYIKEERRKAFVFAYKKGVTDYYREDPGLEKLANEEFLAYEKSLEGGGR